ncbi:MAG: amidase family protein [Hyphomicrobiales bacterium]|nr:amidase family protein [Hyphomicrobiales bacterium]
MSHALERGLTSARDCLEMYLDRIAGVGHALNAVIVLDSAQARARADAADAARRAGRSRGPLHGLPMTVKESFDVAGLPSTFGYADRASHKAQADALAVQRLIAAGANIFGKTNVPKDLADWQSFNVVYGETRNPWNQECSPGGSSGGAAAALAAGLTGLEIGSDIGGSIRIPAHFCGVHGHKPTYGIVPMRGHAMNVDAAPADISVAGPLARSAQDLALALEIMAGPDAESDGAWSLALPRETRTHLKEFRFAVLADDAEFPVDGSISGAIRKLADDLRRAGAQVDEVASPVGSREGYELYLALLRGATSARLSDEAFAQLAAKGGDPAARDYETLMRRGLTQSHRDWLGANNRRHDVRRRWRAFFGDYDALISPVATTVAFPRMPGVPKPEQRFMIDGAPRPAADTYYWLSIASLPSLPATTFPLGVNASGLPVGAQIMGPDHSDFRCIQIAHLIEGVTGGFRAPPGF